jgi:single-stranded-DNA-specific exonuclease
MKRWRTIEVDSAAADRLSQEAGVPLPIAQILVSRGITTGDAADRFLNPRLSELSDPFLLPDMEAAVDRIWQAIDGDEQIVVYGDYDADGVISTALLVAVISRLDARVQPCLPSRLEDGYGFSVDTLDRRMRGEPVDLVITVDCGANDAAAVGVARERGIDVVVTDHHEVGGVLPDAVAIVNPKLGKPAGPGQDDNDARILAGVGVAFKLCRALLKRGRDRGNEAAGAIDLRDYIEWVAIGTVADVVPLLGDNRALVRYGLTRLANTEHAGLKALKQVAGIKGRVDAQHVAFGISPRINAAGRLGNAELALELFLTTDASRARELAGELEEANRDRRAVGKRMLEEADAEVGREFDPEQQFGIVAGSDSWHAGVIGIVASRLSRTYSRPAVVVSFDELGVGTGSCRSIDGFDLVGGLAECSEYLVRFGGHSMAAGLTVKKEQFESFRKKFNAVCSEQLRGRDLRPIQDVDAWIGSGDADETLVEASDGLRPFGEGNRPPVWGVRDARLAGQPRILKDAHLKMALVVGSGQLDAIAFGMGDRTVPDGAMDVLFALEKNSFRGRETLQMNVKDCRPAQLAETGN